MSTEFRPIGPEQDAAMANIVREALKAHGLDIPGTAYFDASLDHLSAYYDRPGRGYSVLDLVKTFNRVNNVEIPYVITARRPGDIAENYADPSKAKELLGWQAEKNLEDMCRDTYRFQTMNPKGYNG